MRVTRARWLRQRLRRPRGEVLTTAPPTSVAAVTPLRHMAGTRGTTPMHHMLRLLQTLKGVT